MGNSNSSYEPITSPSNILILSFNNTSLHSTAFLILQFFDIFTLSQIILLLIEVPSSIIVPFPTHISSLVVSDK